MTAVLHLPAAPAAPSDLSLPSRVCTPAEELLEHLERRALVAWASPEGVQVRRARLLTCGPGRALLALAPAKIDADLIRVEATYVLNGRVVQLDANAVVGRLRHRLTLELDLRHGATVPRARPHLRGPVAVQAGVVAAPARRRAGHAFVAQTVNTLNLSAGGMCIRVHEELQAGAAGLLLNLPSGSTALNGRVLQSSERLARIAFLDLPRPLEELLTAMAFVAAHGDVELE